MANQERNSTNQPVKISKRAWIIEAHKHEEYLNFVRALLEERMGYTLNAGELHTEACAILACLIKEKESFAGMSKIGVKELIEEFVRQYLRIRDEEKYPGIRYAETTSDGFEKAFICIASRALSCVNYNLTREHPPIKEQYFKMSKQ